MDAANKDKYQDIMDYAKVYNILRTHTAFEAVLAAELALIPLYVVTPKSGMILFDLIENGQICFPPDLVFKVPEALGDIQQATKCIAFELPTAAGFHLHRANESVLRAYFKAVAPKLPAPKSRNMGDFLKKLADNNLGEPKVIAALTSLKDLHRNPLFHPEDTLGSTDEAISLMGAVRSAMTEMLRALTATSLVGGFTPLLAGPPS